ncbi:hypothetical protein NDU88_007049 [Pleurodeles waltl]|uniref:Myb/SANT-like DNA-binding domain-containing protein n=1 Tax=Pleurodeles waltl TaxID=8319 RepID=A0AAV7QNQ0_PLEWA|nr:hypothetical protein NDU88_007049 [Pleurodeles waltl]
MSVLASNQSELERCKIAGRSRAKTALVSNHLKKGIWRAIAKDVRTLGVYSRRSTHCWKRWEDLRRWARKMAEAQLGMASQRGRGDVEP